MGSTLQILAGLGVLACATGLPRVGVDGPVYDMVGAAPETTAGDSADGVFDDAVAAAADVVGRAINGLLGGGGGADHGGRDSDVEELFMEQRLDHFDRQNPRTFSQRYFINDRVAGEQKKPSTLFTTEANLRAVDTMLRQLAVGGDGATTLQAPGEGPPALPRNEQGAATAPPSVAPSTLAMMGVGDRNGAASPGTQPESGDIRVAAEGYSSPGRTCAPRNGEELGTLWEGGLSPDTLRQINAADNMLGRGLAKKTLFTENAPTSTFGSPPSEVLTASGARGQEQPLVAASGSSESEDEQDDFSVHSRLKHSSIGPAAATLGVPAAPLLANIGGGSGGDVRDASVATTGVASESGSAGGVPGPALARDVRHESPRKERPSWRLWDLPDLKAEAARLAGPRAGLKYGSMTEDILTRVSQRKKYELVNALVARADFRVELGLEPEWLVTPVGRTPEKRKEQEQKKIKKGLKAAGISSGGKGSGKKTSVTVAECFQARLVCLMLDEKIFQLYQRYKGGKGGLSRGEQDAGRMGKNHRFFFVLSKAMADIEWKNSDGNEISVPDDHANDSRAPQSLTKHLASLDLVGPAVKLQQELRDVWGGQEEGFFADLRGRCEKSLKDVKACFTAYAGREQQSGGAGADKGDDGETLDAIHSYEFMGGKLPTMLYKDLILQLSGGDDGGMAESINADSSKGSGSSMKGGPGVRSVAEKAGGVAAAAPGTVKEKNKGKGKGKRSASPSANTDDLRRRALSVIAKIDLSQQNDLKREAAEREREAVDRERDACKAEALKLARFEQLAKDVDRLVLQERDAATDRSRNMFRLLLRKASRKLAEAEAEMEREEEQLEQQVQHEEEEAAEAEAMLAAAERARGRQQNRRTRDNEGHNSSPFASDVGAGTDSPAAEAALAATSSGDSAIPVAPSTGWAAPP